MGRLRLEYICLKVTNDSAYVSKLEKRFYNVVVGWKKCGTRRRISFV